MAGCEARELPLRCAVPPIQDNQGIGRMWLIGTLVLSVVISLKV